MRAGMWKERGEKPAEVSVSQRREHFKNGTVNRVIILADGENDCGGAVGCVGCCWLLVR